MQYHRSFLARSSPSRGDPRAPTRAAEPPPPSASPERPLPPPSTATAAAAPGGGLRGFLFPSPLTPMLFPPPYPSFPQLGHQIEAPIGWICTSCAWICSSLPQGCLLRWGTCAGRRVGSRFALPEPWPRWWPSVRARRLWECRRH
ncbi:hypothetical protein SEVIR_2G216550v4 [Setaria viridis]